MACRVCSGVTQLSYKHWCILTTWQQGLDQCWYVCQATVLYKLYEVAEHAVHMQNDYMIAALRILRATYTGFSSDLL
jgi:hypothetical protein